MENVKKRKEEEEKKLLLRVINMNTGINARLTKRAIVYGGPTHCAQTQMPTWQQQHYRFSYPTLIAHPLPQNAVVSLVSAANLLLLAVVVVVVVVARATRFRRFDGVVVVVMVIFANVRQNLF